MARILMSHPMLRPMAALGTALALVACDPPETDPGPGSVPDVSGVIEGTVLYVGQRPECDRNEAGEPTAVRGNTILLLFDYDNPPPPQGSATSATSLLVVLGSDMFELDDCMPAEPTAEDLAQVITRSAAFAWPDIALARGENATRSYQIRGFFDRDQDFNPFFSVRRLATRGDVAGGAFVNTAANPPQFERVTFGSIDDVAANGQIVSGVAVTLGAVVNTELPASEIVAGTQGLSSEATIPTTTDALMREQLIWDQTRMRISLIDPERQDWAETLRAAGMSIDPAPSGFGYFTLPVDANRDGAQDFHPTLGTGGILWQHPIVILRRARNPIEVAVGVPDTVIIATVRPSQTLSKSTFDPAIDIAVPGIAAVTLNPAAPECRVPYLAPGNLAELYERIPVDCQELPTGNYDVNILTGIAGGRAVNYRDRLAMDMPGLPPAVLDSLVRGRTDNDWIIEGGQSSSQAWSIPNELGCPDPQYRPNGFDSDGNPITVSQVDPDPRTTCGPPEGPCDDSATNMHCSQGPQGRFSVVDLTPGNAPDASNNTPGHGIAACQTATSGMTGMMREVRYMDVPDVCCEAVQHLCNLPLCPLRDDGVRPNGEVRAIREIRQLDTDYRVNEDGSITPLCTPFLMPASCCDAALP
jgi:hypothetical protein